MRALWVALILIFVLTAGASPALRQIDAEAAFADGVAAFNECDFERAAAGFAEAVTAESGNVPFRLCLAVTYSALDDYEGAIGQLKAAKKVDPHNVVVYFLLANAYEQTGESEAKDATMDLLRSEFSIVDGMVFKSGSTEKLLSDAVETYPDCAIFHNLLADAYALQLKLDLAETEYREAEELAQCWSKPHQNIGALYIQQGETDKAEGKLKEALELDPDNPTANVQMAKVRQMQGRGAEALQEITQAQESGFDPVEALVKKGDLFLDEGRYDEALSSYNKALREAQARGQLRFDWSRVGLGVHVRRPPVAPTVAEAERPAGAGFPMGPRVVRGAATSAIFSRTFLNMALIYATRDDWEGVKDCVWAATYLDPLVMSAAGNLIDYLVESKKIDTALAEFESLLLLNRADVPALHFLAKAHTAKGDSERAFFYYGTLVNLAPTNEEFLLGFGEVANSLRRFDKTLAFLAPQYATVIGHGRFEEVLAVAYFGTGDLEGAARMARVRIGMGVKSPACYSILRRSLAQLGRPKQAIVVLSDASAGAGKDPDLRLELARAFRDADDLTQAIYAYEDCIDLGLDTPEVLLELAETLEDAGRAGEALEMYRAVLDADPDNAPAKNAILRVSQHR